MHSLPFSTYKSMANESHSNACVNCELKTRKNGEKPQLRRYDLNILTNGIGLLAIARVNHRICLSIQMHALTDQLILLHFLFISTSTINSKFGFEAHRLRHHRPLCYLKIPSSLEFYRKNGIQTKQLINSPSRMRRNAYLFGLCACFVSFRFVLNCYGIRYRCTAMHTLLACVSDAIYGIQANTR